jgi:hypothetical protein
MAPQEAGKDITVSDPAQRSRKPGHLLIQPSSLPPCGSSQNAHGGANAPSGNPNLVNELNIAMPGKTVTTTEYDFDLAAQDATHRIGHAVIRPDHTMSVHGDPVRHRELDGAPHNLVPEVRPIPSKINVPAAGGSLPDKDLHRIA